MSTRYLCGWIMLGFAGVTWLLNLCYAQSLRLFDVTAGSASGFYPVSHYLSLPNLLIPIAFAIIGLILIVTPTNSKK